MNKEYFINQLISIIKDYESLKTISEHDDFSGKSVMDNVSELIARSKATVVRIAGEKSEYYKAIEKCYEDKIYLSYDGLRLIHIIGIINALKKDVENDFLKNHQELVHAEVFSDYLEMAEYLVEKNYKDSAAVIAGST